MAAVLVGIAKIDFAQDSDYKRGRKKTERAEAKKNSSSNKRIRSCINVISEVGAPS
jgi:hypothetical protein